jgi:serine/threonine-protein kinase
MAIQGFAQFLKGLHECSALDSHQLRVLSERARCGPPDIHYLGQELLDRGWMTAYQINEINRGHARQLVVGPYLLLERLGKGGMGEVIKARHQRLGRFAALKIVRADRRDDPRRLARFQQEVQTSARVDHPNFVHAYDAGVIDDKLFLAMEFLRGADLRRLVRRYGPLSPRAACGYVHQAAVGLQYAFERGIIHRDIKPSNLFVAGRSQVLKILDLGLARLDEFTTGLTRPGMTLGTVDYLAPEVIGNPQAADIRSDLYGLGCTIYYLLTGGPPFAEGNSCRRVVAHLREEPRPVESVRPDVPLELAGVVRKLLAKQPEQRYQTPVELAQHLDNLLQWGIVQGDFPPVAAGAEIPESDGSTEGDV